MKPEQLKLLAEWYYGEGIIVCSFNNDILRINNGLDNDVNFVPHKDSNQLDMLEDKMIKELNKKYERPIQITITCGRLGTAYFIRYFVSELNGDDRFYLEDEGKTKNEARLNAILNYVGGLEQ